MDVTTLKHGCDLRKGRVSADERIYMLTAVTHKRRNVFNNFNNARLLIASLKHQHDNGNVNSLAFVVMPDHFHWLIVLKNTTLAKVMKQVKGASARHINRAAGLTGTFWQSGYHDHALRCDEDLKQVARYLIANPVRAELVTKVMDYSHWDAIWV